ncbi:hypothetical protein SCHPADRAFT_733565 [Schizopora paradoxa]|uniref:Uncharacterized protein n=1 Tax=Schizopora paradoxa TaxID=27342 RepID=A0A0H2R097_9AGAM|nr:hypothetical protein SCHPADRAFT_733565 [Schizopora paradoxa]
MSRRESSLSMLASWSDGDLYPHPPTSLDGHCPTVPRTSRPRTVLLACNQASTLLPSAQSDHRDRKWEMKGRWIGRGRVCRNKSPHPSSTLCRSIHRHPRLLWLSSSSNFARPSPSSSGIVRSLPDAMPVCSTSRRPKTASTRRCSVNVESRTTHAPTVVQ